jgi:predicted nucleic acid-binding protein
MIFIDSNVPMYLVGGPHPHKVDARRLLEQQVAAGRRLVTDVEVLQEILHRYVAIGRRDAIQPAFDAVLGIVDQVFAVDQQDVEHAKDILYGTERLSARDALHIAVMQRHGITSIMTFDRAFADYPGMCCVS